MDRCDCKCDCSGCTMTRKAYKRKRRDSLLRTLDRAEKIVNGWPAWKQKALGSLHLPSRKK